VRSLEDQMSMYAAYHQDARNKATHFVGVPAIVLSLFIPLSWLRLPVGGITISGAILFAAVVLAYYGRLDSVLAVATAAVTALLLYAAELISREPTPVAVTWFAVLFGGGWALQLLGHVFEGRKPALVDNLFQIFVAPIFLCAEVFFALGYRPELREAVARRAQELRARAGIQGPTPA